VFEELPKAAAAGSQVRSSLPSTSNNGLRTVLIDVDSSLYIQNSESYDNIPTREEIEEAFNPGSRDSNILWSAVNHGLVWFTKCSPVMKMPKINLIST
jgi:hypothetical protein